MHLKTAFRRAHELLVSLRTAAIFIVLTTALCVLGGLVPQHGVRAYYLETYGDRVGRFILFFRIDRIFQSPLFVATITLLFASTLFCSLKRLRTITLAGPSIALFAENKHFSYNREFQDLKRMIFFLRRRGYSIFPCPDNGGGILGYKGYLSKAGVDVVHFGVILMLVAGLVSAATRSEDFVWMREGDSHRVPSGHTLVLDRFEYLKYDDGSPKDWISTFSIAGDSDPKRRETVEVNNPLRIGGYRLYQNSYRFTYTISIAITEGKKRREYSVKEGDLLTVYGHLIRFKRFIPDYAVDERKGIYSASEEMRNPLLVADLYGEDRYTGSLSLPLSQPRVVGENADGEPFYIELTDVNNVLESGIKIVKEQGFMLIIASISLVLLGLVLSLYGREKIVKIEPKGGFWQLSAGSPRRGGTISAEEFKHLVSRCGGGDER
jgi:cytochrome c biogenesis protein ResB